MPILPETAELGAGTKDSVEFGSSFTRLFVTLLEISLQFPEGVAAKVQFDRYGAVRDDVGKSTHHQITRNYEG